MNAASTRYYLLLVIHHFCFYLVRILRNLHIFYQDKNDLVNDLFYIKISLNHL